MTTLKHTARHEVAFWVDSMTARSVELAAARVRGELAARRSIRDVYFDAVPSASKAVSGKVKKSEYRVRHQVGSATAAVQQHTRESARTKLRETVVKAPTGNLTWVFPGGGNAISSAGREAVATADLLSQRKSCPNSLHWFSKKINKHDLHPTIDLAFDRYAYDWARNEDAFRLTIDRELTCHRLGDRRSSGTTVTSTQNQPLSSSLICMRFTGVMPVEFKRLAVEFGLCPSSATAFSRCRSRLRDADDQIEYAGASPDSKIPASTAAATKSSPEGLSCLNS